MKTTSIGCVSLSMVLLAWAQTPPLSTYKIDVGRSTAEINVFKGGLFKTLGHDPIIAARSFSGTVQFEASRAKDSSVALDIDSASLTAL